jgi:hypothetical protein
LIAGIGSSSKSPSRAAWSGVRIDLAINQPTPQALRKAVGTVLDTPNYRWRASQMADEFAGIDTRVELLSIIEVITQASDQENLQRSDTVATNRRRRVASQR